MRILHVVGFFPCLSETFILNQIMGAIRQGHDVWVYSAYGAPSDTLPEPSELSGRVIRAAPLGRTAVTRLTEGTLLFARAMVRNPSKGIRLLNVRRYGWEAASLKLLHQGVPLLAHNAFDVIHCQFGSLAPLTLALRREKILEGAVVVNFRGHDISSEINGSGAMLYEDVFQDADFFVANCEYFERRLALLGCDERRLHVVYSGIKTGDIEYQSPRESFDCLRLIAIGRLVEKKGFTYALGVAKELKERGTEFRLSIIGNGPLAAELRAEAVQLGVESNVKFLGALPQARVLELLRHSDVMIAPNVVARDGDEDAPINTIKEAMAVGVPVVSTRHGGIPEVVKHGVTGLLSSERDVKALTAHVVALAQSPNLRRRVSVSARHALQRKFELDTQQERLMVAYHAAVSHYANRRASDSSQDTISAESSPCRPSSRIGELE